MSVVITPIDVSNTSFTFGSWVAKTNTIIDFISSNAVSLDSTSGGSVTTGNGVVNGVFSITTLGVSTLRGGNVSASAPMNVTTNTVFINGANTTLSVNNDVVTSNVATRINSTLTVTSVANLQSTLNVNGAVNVTNSVTVNGTLTGNGAVTFTTTLAVNTSVTVGNSTGNVVINSTAINIGGNIINSTSSGSSADISANSITVGANVNMNTTSTRVGNSTIIGDRVTVGNSTVNSFVTQTSLVTGNTTANLTINSTTLRVGNSSVNTAINTSSITTSSVIDGIGNVRDIPQNPQTTSYSLLVTDAGKHISITTGGVTVPASVFSVGQTISIYNNSGSDQTITQGGSVTLRFAGTANTGNRTLAQYGLATVLCVGSNIFVISGAGLS
jgi:hypothetical protein